MEKIDHPFVFQCDSEIVNDIYKNENNYLIDETAYEDEDKYCCIYFSSNDIYFPNREDVFKKRITENNAFEWYGTRVKKASKHIFLRDIKKQWYLSGINKEINTIEKLTQFLKKETEGYRVITLGSSAGGYASVLLGSFLNAEYMLSFNGQFFLNDLLTTSTEKINPIVFREQHNSAINRFYSIKEFINAPQNIYYFHSSRSQWDITQYNHIKSIKIRTVSFRTGHHGIPFLKSNLKYVINLPLSKLNDLAVKSHYPFLFSIKIEGVLKTFISFSKQILLFFKKRFML